VLYFITPSVSFARETWQTLCLEIKEAHNLDTHLLMGEDEASSSPQKPKGSYDFERDEPDHVKDQTAFKVFSIYFEKRIVPTFRSMARKHGPISLIMAIGGLFLKDGPEMLLDVRKRVQTCHGCPSTTNVVVQMECFESPIRTLQTLLDFFRQCASSMSKIDASATNTNEGVSDAAAQCDWGHRAVGAWAALGTLGHFIAFNPIPECALFEVGDLKQRIVHLIEIYRLMFSNSLCSPNRKDSMIGKVLLQALEPFFHQVLSS